MTQIIPISLREANEYVTNNHRHHKAVDGYMKIIGNIYDNPELLGGNG